MKFNPFNYVRYLLEFVIIITGVLLSFYLDDLRQLGEKESYKDTLIEELLVTSQEDLKQIEKITEFTPTDSEILELRRKKEDDQQLH